MKNPLRLVCIKCGEDSVIARQEPGVNHYAPCLVCGTVGIKMANDLGKPTNSRPVAARAKRR